MKDLTYSHIQYTYIVQYIIVSTSWILNDQTRFILYTISGVNSFVYLVKAIQLFNKIKHYKINTNH